MLVNAVRMNSLYLAYALLGGLAIGLMISVYTDVRYRLILNKVTLPIALAAPAYWAATEGLSLWIVGYHLALGAGVFVLFSLFFLMKAMGGGDVKLLAALALWFPFQQVFQLLLFTSLAGLAVTIVFFIIHRLRKMPGNARIPYGVAISFAGLWIAGEQIFNHFS